MIRLMPHRRGAVAWRKQSLQVRHEALPPRGGAVRITRVLCTELMLHRAAQEKADTLNMHTEPYSTLSERVAGSLGDGIESYHLHEQPQHDCKCRYSVLVSHKRKD